MEKPQQNKFEKNKFLFGIIIGVAAMLILFSIVYFAGTRTAETIEFSEYLHSGNFNAAGAEYESMSNRYVKPFNSYLESVIADYNNSVITYEDAVSLLAKLKKNGFSGEPIDSFESQLESLHESKEMFLTADSLYNEQKQSEARDYFTKVIEWDANFAAAQEKIAKIDAYVQSTIDEYSLADELYLSNDTQKAYEQYQLIIDKGVDTEKAEKQIAKIDDIKRAWEAEFADSDYSRYSYPYGAAAKGDYIYLPYSYNDTYAIVKYNTADKTAEVFPLTKMTAAFVIKDINIIDNYLYFIAGENVGAGRTFLNPYNIYRMKDDGTELELAASGDYENLIAYKDGFYAVSYSEGLVKLDRNLKFTETITESVPEIVQLVEDKLYYTVPEHTPYKMITVMYVYDGVTSEKIKQETLLRFGFYSGIELNTYKAYEYYEKLFFINKAEEKEFLLKFDDIKMLYGLVGSNIVYSMETRSGKDDYFVYSRVAQEEIEYTYKVPKEVTALSSICFEKELIIFSTDYGFLVKDSSFNFVNEIKLSGMEIDKMEISNDISFENNPIYTDEEVVIVEDDFWHYSSSTYHISIESRYINDVDTNIYVAHIRTTDPMGIYIDSPDDDTHLTLLRKNPLNLSRQFNAVLACNGDFFDEPANAWTGISIRDGIVYKKELRKDMMAIYPDGSLLCHTADENIRYEEFLYAGVRDTLSFGPILLTKGEYGNDIYTNFLAGANPRCALGMVEPGHYVIILADGRQPNSSGITLKRLADLFIEEGCVEAYNLDGGQSAAMMFMGEYVNTHQFDYTGSGFRAIGEIVYFGTSDLVPEEIK